MKKKFATAMPVYDAKSEQNDAIPTGQNGNRISYQGLCDIVRARMEEVLRLIVLELPQGEQDMIVPGGLVLTGGTSNLPGIDALGREILRMPVRVGSPLPVNGISDLTNPAYATAVGLVLWGIKPQSVSAWKSRGFSGNVTNLISRIKGLFSRSTPAQ
ncbi:MAG TPA: cell division FtsA domain-containing protein, partial [Dehalococcoidales bacterium]|nr:cell division FtsA domain-containing protein [Dehalococcoidales bacterium]